MTAPLARLDWVDWLRGAAVVLVVFYHAVIALDVADLEPPQWAVLLNTVVAPYRMPMLMFLSGLLLPLSLGKPARQYVAGKLRRIGWPYLVWTAVIVVFLIGASQVFGDGNYGLADIPRIVLDPRTYTWYLAYLLAFYLLALILPTAVRIASIPVLLGVSVVVADGDGWSRLSFLLAFFFLGELAARRPGVWAAASRKVGVLVLAIAAFVAAGALTLTGHVVRYDVLSVVAVLSLLVTGRAVAERACRFPVASVLTVVGRHSIVFYTVHWIIVTAVAHLVGRAAMDSETLALGALLLAGLGLPALWVAAADRLPWLRWAFELPVRPAARRSSPSLPAAHRDRSA